VKPYPSQGQTPKQYLMSRYVHLSWVHLNTESLHNTTGRFDLLFFGVFFKQHLQSWTAGCQHSRSTAGLEASNGAARHLWSIRRGAKGWPARPSSALPGSSAHTREKPAVSDPAPNERSWKSLHGGRCLYPCALKSGSTRYLQLPHLMPLPSSSLQPPAEHPGFTQRFASLG